MTLSGYDAHILGHGKGREEPIVIEESKMLDKDQFVLPAHYAEDIKSILLTRGMIEDRIEKVAFDISRYYPSTESLHIICLLKGGRMFFQNLTDTLNRIYRFKDGQEQPPFVEYFVNLKKDKLHPGHIHTLSDDLSGLSGKNVLVVEDLVDTGKTLSKFCRSILELEPKSLRVASLFEKRTSKDGVTFKADFAGFSIPDLFVVGNCMDLNERFRDLEHLAILTDEAYSKYKN